MTLTENEIERVEEEAAAIGADPGQVAAALARMDAIKTAAEEGATLDAVSLWEVWRFQGAVIQRIDVGGVVLTQESRYVGKGGVDFSTPGYIGIE